MLQNNAQENQDKKVVVFGGAGFLGSHVADILTDRGYQVVIFDLKKSPYLKEGQISIVGDIADEKAVGEAVRDCDVVYNFAAIADMDEAKNKPLDTVQTNILGNAVLLEACRKNDVKRFVFASTLYVYSNVGSFYRSSKQACELLIENYREIYGLDYTILRYGSLYGPRADENNWIHKILKQAISQGKITRYGDGQETREYIHVFDAARLSVDILAEEYKNQHVIIAGNQPTKIKDSLLMIKEMLGNKIDLEFLPPIIHTGHYEITPYNFTPKLAKRIQSNNYVDFGQGILSLINEIYQEQVSSREIYTNREKPKILITTSTFGKLDSEPLEKLKKHGFEVVMNSYGRKITSQELRELLPGAVGIIAGTEVIDKETMKNSNLKVISRVGVGIDNIDLETAKELGIIVKNTPDAPTIAVAELTLGGILALLRQIPQMNQEVHNKKWEEKIGVQLSGKTVLIIGFGRIGRYLAKLLKPFGVKLLAADPALSGQVDGVEIVSLQDGISQAEIISLHLSGSSQVLGKDEFDAMKKGVYILNAARGGVINEGALMEALKEGKVAGAWLDTFQEEPYSGPLTEFPQVLLTPHIGSYTDKCRVQMEREAVDNLLAELDLF